MILCYFVNVVAIFVLRICGLKSRVYEALVGISLHSLPESRERDEAPHLVL